MVGAGPDDLAAEIVENVRRERPDYRRILDDENPPPGKVGSPGCPSDAQWTNLATTSR